MTNLRLGSGQNTSKPVRSPQFLKDFVDNETKVAFQKVASLMHDCLFRLEAVAMSDGKKEAVLDILKQLEISRGFIKDFLNTLPK